MSNHDNPRRGETKRSEHGPRYENPNPSGQRGVARGRARYKKLEARKERRTVQKMTTAAHLTADQVAHIVKKLVTRWGKHPYDINRQDSERFGNDIVDALEGRGVARCMNVDDLGALDHYGESLDHYVVQYGGRFYDAEEPYGVEDWKHLPEVSRALRGYR